MYTVIPDEVIQALEIGWDDSANPPKPYIANLPPEARVVRDFLNTPFWEGHVEFSYPGVLERSGRVSNDSGFFFATNLEPDDIPFTGVQVFDPIGTITLSDNAFDLLMSRYFRFLIDYAQSRCLKVIQESWWDDFLGATKQIEERVKNASSV